MQRWGCSKSGYVPVIASANVLFLQDSISPEDSGSKVALKPKTKKPAGGKKQDKVLKPVQAQSGEAGEDRGAPAGRNSKRGKK